MGSFGESGRPFIEDIAQAENKNILNAVIGGVVFNFANRYSIYPGPGLYTNKMIAAMFLLFVVGLGLVIASGN